MNSSESNTVLFCGGSIYKNRKRTKLYTIFNKKFNFGSEPLDGDIKGELPHGEILKIVALNSEKIIIITNGIDDKKPAKLILMGFSSLNKKRLIIEKYFYLNIISNQSTERIINIKHIIVNEKKILIFEENLNVIRELYYCDISGLEEKAENVLNFQKKKINFFIKWHTLNPSYDKSYINLRDPSSLEDYDYKLYFTYNDYIYLLINKDGSPHICKIIENENEIKKMYENENENENENPIYLIFISEILIDSKDLRKKGMEFYNMLKVDNFFYFLTNKGFIKSEKDIDYVNQNPIRGSNWIILEQKNLSLTVPLYSDNNKCILIDKKIYFFELSSGNVNREKYYFYIFDTVNNEWSYNEFFIKNYRNFYDFIPLLLPKSEHQSSTQNGEHKLSIVQNGEQKEGKYEKQNGEQKEEKNEEQNNNFGVNREGKSILGNIQMKNLIKSESIENQFGGALKNNYFYKTEQMNQQLIKEKINEINKKLQQSGLNIKESNLANINYYKNKSGQLRLKY